MATCALTGTLVDPSGTAVASATISACIITPVFDAGGSFVVPKEISTSTNASGVFTLTLDQAVVITLTIQYPPNATDAIRRYNYNFTVPSAATASFNSTLITEL